MYMRNNDGPTVVWAFAALPWSVVFDWIGYHELLYYTDVCCLNNYRLIVKVIL